MNMRISDSFPSKYLKADDLNKREVKVIVEHVEKQEINGEEKPVIFFQGKKPGLICNKTNQKIIVHAWGDETDKWHGLEMTLCPTTVDFQGKSVSTIRVKPSPSVDSAF
jgi:hypothetical protein